MRAATALYFYEMGVNNYNGMLNNPLVASIGKYKIIKRDEMGMLCCAVLFIYVFYKARGRSKLQGFTGKAKVVVIDKIS